MTDPDRQAVRWYDFVAVLFFFLMVYLFILATRGPGTPVAP